MTQQGPTIKSWQFRKLRGLLLVALFALASALAGAGLTAEPTQKRFVIEHYALAGAALYGAIFWMLQSGPWSWTKPPQSL